MTLIQSIILGVVEGLTEFLPVSSTAHLDLVRQLMGIVGDDFAKSFEIIIQLGAILAVLVFYWRFIVKNFKASSLKVIVAFLPTAVIGYFLYPLVKNVFLGNNLLMIVALILGGLGLLLFDRRLVKSGARENWLESMSYGQAAAVGLAQSVAIIPGVSRSAATILGGLGAGLDRRAAVEFSFLLAIPTMLAATGWDIIKQGLSFDGNQWLLLLAGFLTAFVSALLVIKIFLKYIRKHNFAPFGVYRIVVGVLLYWFFFLR